MQSTEHYGYRLPQQGENARVTDLNFNTTKMDNIEYNTRRMIAPLYDINATYNTGDKVEEDGELCICKEDNVTGAFDPTKWDVKPVSELLDESSSKLVYSTTEQEIGVWVDGSKLYQITYVPSNASVSGTFTINIPSNIEIKSISGIGRIFLSNRFYYVPIGSEAASISWTGPKVDAEPYYNRVTVTLDAPSGASQPYVQVTIQYTKSS